MSDNLKNGISMVLLSYEEEENLRVLLPQIKEKLEECGEYYEIIVVDSAEALDNTREVCEENGARYVNQEGEGFGNAFRTGIRFAQHQKFFIMDTDGSHDPKYIPDIYHIFMREHADVAIGSRYIEGGVTNDVITSKIISRSLNKIYGVIIGIHAKDMSTDFRLYHTSGLKEVEPEEEAQMTIRDFVKNTMVKAMEERLNDLMKIGAPAVMIDGQRKAIEAMANGTMKIGGDTEALDDVYASHEVRKGTGGRQYFAINGNVNFFPNARYGMFIKRA